MSDRIIIHKPMNPKMKMFFDLSLKVFDEYLKMCFTCEVSLKICAKLRAWHNCSQENLNPLPLPLIFKIQELIEQRQKRVDFRICTINIKVVKHEVK